MHIMVIIHDEVEYEMNKLVLLNDIKKEKKVNNIKQEKSRCKLNTIEPKDYSNFKEKFCGYISGNIKENTSIINQVSDIIRKIFFINNRLFIDLINFLYDDCLGTSTAITFEDLCDFEKDDFIVSVLDDYREFKYRIGIQSYDCNNIAIYIKKFQVCGNYENVVNFQVKRNQYKKACDNEDNTPVIKENNEFKVLVIDSDIEVPDLFEYKIDSDKKSEIYELNIFKSWKYDFKKLAENKIYMLSPLKIFDFKKRLNALKQEGYTEKFLKEEIGRFFKEINAPLYRMKDSGNIIDEDIKQINMIAMELLSCFMKDKCLDLSDMYQKLP